MTIEQETLLEVAKAYDERELRLILSVVPTELLENELNRRQSVVTSVHTAVAEVIRQYDEDMTLIEKERSMKDLVDIIGGKVSIKPKFESDSISS